jgi:uncharacterized protein with HEPN domain
MKKGGDDLLRLQHIMSSIDFINKNIDRLEESEFYQNELLKFAVLKHIEIIGEAANFLSDDIITKYSEVEWAKIIGSGHYYVSCVV